MLTVHHLNNSRSHRILWLLEELGCEYEVKRYARDPRTLAESGAIIEYLLDTYGQGRLRPAPGSEARLRYNYWLHYAEGSAMPPLLLKLVFQRLPKGPVPALLRPIVRTIAARAQERFIDPQLKTHIAYWEEELTRFTWFAGEEFSAAD